ncbi:amidohydrolase [Amycolatopsis panacis]|uniref:Amidohydrolase n=1 Tax=Amycolatopsis panacis TaxID=2340917 RepID=A0A419I6J8_9PSEU|nr:amidohydrolase [Amycolatopsis panacis]RJQ87062.1 amidohydrolase [Amycolatopsis panacis]
MAYKAIVGGYVVPIGSAPIDGGTVLLEDDRITRVGAEADVEVPEEAELVDASGSWVLPGFIDAHAHLGVSEEGEGWSGSDVNEMTDPNGARFRAIDGIDPYETGFDDALSGGVTSVVIKPGSGNPIGGQTVGVKTWGRSILDMTFAEQVSVKSALGENPKRVYGDKQTTPSTRLGVASILREAFTKARNYQAKRAHALSEGKPFETDLTNETLAKVLDGELYWDQHVHRADDMITAIRLAEEFGYRLVINHGTEGHLIADLLAEREVPVILGPLFTTRSKVELRHRSLRSAGILARAGVKIAITTDHPVVPINFLVYQAALAVKDGLDPETALKALTVHPAEMLGLSGRIGSLTPGLDADVVVWSGDPLDVMNRAMRVFIRGREVYSFDESTGEGVPADRRYREAR